MANSVIYAGPEVALLAGILAGALPRLDDEDFEVADMLLEKALAALPHPMPQDLAAKIEHQRMSPTERFWTKLVAKFGPGDLFNIIDAGLAAGVTSSRAWMLLEELQTRKPTLQRADSHLWVIKP